MWLRGGSHSDLDLLPCLFFGLFCAVLADCASKLHIRATFVNGFCMLAEAHHVANILYESLSCIHRFPKPLASGEFTAAVSSTGNLPEGTLVLQFSFW
jgi:hypothetical protein